jgi:branched-chain amino acid transport system ATP-binding protein
MSLALENPERTGTATAGSHSKPVLRASGIRKLFGGFAVLDGVSVTLRRGEVVLLRGANGSGKTTLLNILTGNLEPDGGTIEFLADGTPERFRFPRRWWDGINPFDHFAPERVAAERFGRSWQDVRLFSTQDLLTNVAVAAPGQLGENPLFSVCRWGSVRRQEAANRTASAQLLQDLGLGGRLRSRGDRISLGQSKRVAVARALRGGAEVLFLDEPLAGLDLAGIEQTLAMLTELARSRNITLVLIEHVMYIPRLLDIATTVWTLEHGQLRVESPDEVRRSLASQNGQDGGLAFLTEARRSGLVTELPLGRGATLLRVPAPATQQTRPVLEVRDLAIHRGGRLVIGHERDGETVGVSFVVREGDLAVLSAPNGWGKTTLLEAIAGLLPCTRGSIEFGGRDITRLAPWERARIGLSLFQARDHLFPNLTVAEGMRLAGVHPMPNELAPYATRRMGSLSGGEGQQAAIACAFRQKAMRFVLFDEPFSALDAVASSRFSIQLRSRSHLATVFVAVPAFHQ